MQLPQINLNGSTGMELASQYQEAADAIAKAVNLMSAIPHGRDYQTLPAGSFEKAREEMIQRVMPLIIARNELFAIAIHCAN